MKQKPKNITKAGKELDKEFREAVERVYASDKTHLPELIKAADRLHAWPDHNGQSDLTKPNAALMRWAIVLASRHLNEMSSGEFQNLQYELAFFACREWVQRDLTPFDFHSLIPSKALIEKVQHWLRESLQIIVESQPPPRQAVAYPFTALTRFLSFTCDSDHPNGHWETGWGTTSENDDPEKFLEERIIGYFMDVLEDHADNLRRCPCEDCGRLFLRNRINASCCSRICTSRHAKRKELGILPERFGKRGRPPGTNKTKGKTDGQKNTQKEAAPHRTKSRRLSAKRP